jgi:uncharacterized RDD family membrane protein YckC
MEDEYPPLIARLQSIFIDTMVIIVAMIIVSKAIDNAPGIPDWLRIFLFLGIFIFYEPLCLTFGCTVGNYIRGIRVRRFSNTNSRINFFQAMIRYAVKVMLGWISFLTIHGNPSRRAIHDLASGSVMIYRHKKID